MRIAKLLIDSGLPFDSANSVVSQEMLWSKLAHDEVPTERYLLIWPPYHDHIIFDTSDLHHLTARINEAQANGVFTLLNLADVQKQIADSLRSAAPGAGGIRDSKMPAAQY